MNARRQALRYLGVKAPDADMEALLDEGFAALEVAAPRHRLAVLPTERVLAMFESRALAAHLSGCEEAALLAATLGTQADRLIQRAEATDTLRAAVLHACAAAKIEAYCDAVQEALPGAVRPRFSPGYGDFSLSMQQKLLDATDAGRRIGLYLTRAHMLAPAKSITAVMGLGPPLAGCPQAKCARCGKKDCAFRGEDGPCS